MKEKLIGTSIQLFGDKGFSETSIQDIVKENGVTKGTFYYYFSSKEELLLKIHLDFIEDILIKQRDIISDASKTYREKLHDIVFLLISNIKTQGASAKIFFREMRHLNHEHLSKIIPKRDEYRINLQKLLKLGIESGEFRSDLRPDMLALGILGMTNWSYFWYEPEGEVKDQELTNIYVNMILNGINHV